MSSLPPLSVIRLFRDGSCMGALLGPDLLIGEAEYAAIEPPGDSAAIARAGEAAAVLLETRLGIAHLHLQRVLDQDAQWREAEPESDDGFAESDDDQWWRYC